MKKIFNKVVKKALPIALATTLISPLYPIKQNKANAIELISIGYSFLDKSSSKTNKQTNLYKQNNTNKQKKEFIPPKLPYCKINYAGRKGINVTYWTKDGKKYDLSWAVTNVTAGIGGATVSLRALYTNGNYGVYELSSTDYSKLINCVAEAAKDAIAGPHYNPGVDVDKLYLKQVKGDLKNYSVLKFREYR